MLPLRRAASPLVASLMLLGAGSVSGQDFPNKPVRIVAPEPGGGADLVARILAQGLSSSLGQQVVVDNRGGSAIIAAEIVSKAPPDGHTILFAANVHWLLPLFQEKVPYDPIKDYAPVSMAATSPSVIAVHPSLPVKSVRELIALAKASPGKINCASGAMGSTTYLSAELFKAMAGVNIVNVPYKGGGPALNATIGGQVDMLILTTSVVMPHVKMGRLKALAVTSLQPSELAPGLPTATATGLPGYESRTVLGVFVPAKTPEAVITQLNREVVRFLVRPDTKEKLFNSGFEVVASSPGDFMSAIKSEIAKIGKMIKDAGIKTE